jgi:hypothetical protein
MSRGSRSLPPGQAKARRLAPRDAWTSSAAGVSGPPTESPACPRECCARGPGRVEDVVQKASLWLHTPLSGGSRPRPPVWGCLRALVAAVGGRWCTPASVSVATRGNPRPSAAPGGAARQGSRARTCARPPRAFVPNAHGRSVPEATGHGAGDNHRYELVPRLAVGVGNRNRARVVSGPWDATSLPSPSSSAC